MRNGFAYCVGPCRAHAGPYGPIWVHMGPYGSHMGPYGHFWGQKDPVLTHHLLTYHVAAHNISAMRSRLQRNIRPLLFCINS